ncbi:helix-turn-helix protein [Halohasta litchfieldiae]|jgi:helix-turn-helix protein|uniref:Taxis protein CheF n=1 Tax=Halohasta litchfieldiae TaxID=1073996 RepID=A0A1H6TJU0_9EURY|nr:CheF family chemotaxis protein [Halohasta litchfieldiae]ATW88883.1 helix-turn-helix protein [Halohasta litchfieldiae]SEI80318.1 HTH domain-containing protein [Halohasta litchfieldiae]
MSETAVADFVGRFHTADVESAEPVTGRILLSHKRLVLATGDFKTTIPLSNVIDINLGTVPPALAEFFSDTVTIAYADGDSKRTAIIEGKGENVERFKTVFFKVLLSGQTVIVKHPAKRGGRVTDAGDRKMKLKLSEGTLRLDGNGGDFEIDLGSVTSFGREKRNLGGKTRPALTVDHASGGTTLSTIITLPNNRKLNLLGRFLKLEYSELMEELEDLTFTEEQIEALVTLYSAGGRAKLQDLLTGDVNETQVILDQLRDKELIEDIETGMKLTAKGQAVVSDHIEDVNM